MGLLIDDITTNKKNIQDQYKELYNNIKHTISGSSARKGYMAMMDHAVYGGTTFAISILLARLTSPTEFGAFVIVFSIMLFAKGIQTAVITEPMVIIGAPKDGEELHRYVSSTAAGQAVFGVLSTALFYGAYLLLKALGVSPSITNAILGLALAIFFILGQEFFRRILFMRTKPGQVFINDVIFSLLQLSGVYLLYNANSLSSQSAFWAIGFGAAIAALLGLFQCRRYLTFDFSEFQQVLKTNWEYGRWALASSITQWTSGESYFFISAIFLGSTAPAILRACKNLVTPIHIVLMGLDNVVQPVASKKFVSGGLNSLNIYLKSVGGLLILTMSLYGLFVIFNVEWLLTTLYGDKYSGYGNISTIYVIIYFISTVSRPFIIGLRALRRPKDVFYAFFIHTIVLLLVATPLIKTFEILGAVMGMLLAVIFMFVTLSIRYKSFANHYS